MNSGRVDVISSKGCSRLFLSSSTLFPAMNSARSSAVSSPASVLLESTGRLAGGPFTGLVICVTGLSKEARKEVMTATERLGGRYSATLHPQCTHLVVQSFSGRKFEHALKHGPKSGLLIVTLGWFVDSVRRNVRLNESLYSVKSTGESGLLLEDLSRFVGLSGTEKSCLPATVFQEEKTCNKADQLEQSFRKEISDGLLFTNDVVFIDESVSSELKKKVAETASREGAKLLDEWFIGCNATHVICEGSSLQRYIGHTNNLVTPLWILKSAKTKNLQRLVHLSSDLAKQVNMALENAKIDGEECCQGVVDHNSLSSGKSKSQTKSKGSIEDRQRIVDFAKLCVRNRRSLRIRSCQFPIRPITPSSILESITWSISEPPSSAQVHMESSWTEDAGDNNSCGSGEARDDCKASEACDDLLRSLRESEKQELLLKNHFLTILFPIDRFGELGPSSRTFFSNGGFTCIQLLEHIYNFYQEDMSVEEVDVAIHTDSRHADRLRSIYASNESVGIVSFKRIDFLGSRKSFEVLKRVSGENNSNVYELLIRA